MQKFGLGNLGEELWHWVALGIVFAAEIAYLTSYFRHRRHEEWRAARQRCRDYDQGGYCYGVEMNHPTFCRYGVSMSRKDRLNVIGFDASQPGGASAAVSYAASQGAQLWRECEWSRYVFCSTTESAEVIFLRMWPRP